MTTALPMTGMTVATADAAQAALVVAAIAWPLVLTLLWLVPAVRRRYTWLAPTMALPALVLVFTADATIELRAPGLFTSLMVGVDPVGRPFLLLTALLWSLTGLHAHTYMKHDARRGTFTAFLLATGAGNIGATLAQDAFGFYLFFALMTFAAFGLVVHTRTHAALFAGRIYIIMAVLGEALLLAGLLAVVGVSSDASFARITAAFTAFERPAPVAALLLFGFGVKAGLLPLHLWLPLAHPVAPTPASALLSGAMIKVGVLGWLRFLPLGELPLPGLGALTLGLGAAATFYAAAVGVMQAEPKTVLAYSSVSQMGFLTMGIGAALIMPAAAPLLVFAVVVYALHHAFAKAALFLAIGIVPAAARGRRVWPWLAVTAVPALALAGAPLTSGALAKLALKDALGELPGPWPGRIDLILAAAAVGTTLLMARYLATLRQQDARVDARSVDQGDASRGGDRADIENGVAAGPILAPAGLVLPWAGLVVVSAFAAVWLPLALAPLGELPLATRPHYIAAAAWPVALGVLLAATTVAVARRFPAATLRTVPAGDIVHVVARALAELKRRTAPLRETDIEALWTRLWQRVFAAVTERVDATAQRLDVGLAGAGIGAVLCMLALALFLLS